MLGETLWDWGTSWSGKNDVPSSDRVEWIEWVLHKIYLPPPTPWRKRKLALDIQIMLNSKAKTLSWLHLKLPSIALCLKREKKGAAIGKDLCDWWDYENNVEKMVPVSYFGKVSEHFLSHPSQRLYSIHLKLKVAISENIPCHLSNYLSIKCNQRWPLRNQWIIKGRKVLESGSIVIT